jgi:hypothetical protein
VLRAILFQAKEWLLSFYKVDPDEEGVLALVRFPF